MNPNNQAPTPPEKSPYDFILDTEHTHKKKLIPKADHNSLKGRMLMVFGGGAVLIIVVTIAYSLIFGGKESNAQALVSLVAKQQEIARVADTGIKSASDPAVRGLAQTIKLSISSEQRDLKAYLAKKKQKITPFQLASAKNTQTDTNLTTALNNNSFDKVFTQTIMKSLASYLDDLEKDYNNSDNPTAKTILKDSFNSTEILLK